ncbi:Detected protein of unknown function [Hibiscus syriacus]|uniref:Transcription factor TCP12 n=1 Tax=Hibiscus syriacus TaxID=106335 RepID=A0A6A2XGZ5_HIBSY|nr:Detected protein of unknown function [Hibiscus syriacus]
MMMMCVLLMSNLLSLAQQQILGSTSNNAPPDSEINAASPIMETKKVLSNNRKRSTGNSAKQGTPRKRTGKKDRHSKIYTAHGPRDRRMRLSLQIARKFFDLQDMLGFDKASKTIEWLFSKSKASIKELTENLPAALKHGCSTGGGKSVSSTSESEVVSAAKYRDNTGEQQCTIARGESMRSSATTRVAKERKSRKVSFNHVARESRDKARARARERTREKMKMKGIAKTSNISDELIQLQSSSPLQIGEYSDPSTETNNSLMVVAEEEDKVPQHNTVHSQTLEHQMDYVGSIERFLGITRSSSMFNYSNNMTDSSGEYSAENCPVFSGNWGMRNERIQYSYCAMTSIKDSTGNTQEQNPSIIFMTDPNEQEQKSSSNFIANSYAKVMNHNSDLTNPSNGHAGRNPTSFLMSTPSDIGFRSDYQENPVVASKFHKFY